MIQKRITNYELEITNYDFVFSNLWKKIITPKTS